MNDGDQPTMYISSGNIVSFNRPKALYNAISGRHRLVAGGQGGLRAKDRGRTERHPRTAVGIAAGGMRMGWVVVDGRQAGYSQGLSLVELEAILLKLGFAETINLDGGGSSVLVAADADGDAYFLSRPINHRIPHRDRHVANHLGLRVAPD